MQHDYLTVCAYPAKEDIHPRAIIWTKDAGSMALALLPWARRVKLFTAMAAMRILGYQPKRRTHVRAIKRLHEQVVMALRRLKADKVGYLPEDYPESPEGHVAAGHSYYLMPDHAHEPRPDIAMYVSAYGYSLDASEPPVVRAQVDACHAWLKEHARPTTTIARKFVSGQFAKLVEIWTTSHEEYSQIPQTEYDTGGVFTDQRLMIQRGAFITAALEAGYRTQLFQAGPNCYFNISYHKTGEKFRGRTPTGDRAELYPNPVKRRRGQRLLPVSRNALMDIPRMAAKLKAFLQLKLDCQEFLNQKAVFSIAEAAKKAGIKCNPRNPPKVLLMILRDLGCVDFQQKVRVKDEHTGGERRTSQRLWCRLTDMPKWQQNALRRQQWLKDKRKDQDQDQ